MNVCFNCTILRILHGNAQFFVKH